MDINKFIFGAYGILLTRFLRSYKPYTLTHRAAKLAEHTVPKRHVYNQIFLYFRKPDVKNYPLFRSLLPGHDRWFQTTASSEYRYIAFYAYYISDFFHTATIGENTHFL